MLQLLPVKTNREEWLAKAEELYNRANTTRLSFIKASPLLNVRQEASVYTEASQAYEIGGDALSSAKCKKRAACILGRQLRCSDQAALLYHEAARTLRNKVTSASSETERLYDFAITEYCEAGRYYLAGRVEEQRANMRQSRKDVNGAIKGYESASIYYRSDGRIDQANEVDELRAQMLGTLPSRFEKAAAIYEELGKAKSNGNLTQPDYCSKFLRAGLLLLASGWSQSALEEKLRDMCSNSTALQSFYQSRQFLFLHNVAACIETCDLDRFADHIYFYDSVDPPLGPWSLNLLEVMMKRIEKKK
jgi:tetratricopeptide (TPR) repeat protein